MEFLPLLQAPFDDQKPSLFELLSEQQLSSLLPPTLRYLLAAAAQRHPRHLLRALNSFDELYALVSLVVESHYLRTRGASFTEAFYSLRRERAPRTPTPRAAAAAPSLVSDALAKAGSKAAGVWRNLAVVVLVPYLKRKLDDAYDVEAPRAAVMGARYTQMPPDATARQRVLFYYKWFLRNVYPSVNAAYYFAMLAFNLAYLFDGSRFHSPFNWLVGMRVRRMTAADQQAVDAALAAAAKTGAAPVGRSLTSLRSLGPSILSSLSVMLPVGIFALKFLEWWHASDFAKHLSQQTTQYIDLPPPSVSGLDAGSSPHAAHDEAKDKQKEKTSATSDEDAPPWEPSPDTAPIATASLLPILTVPPPTDSALCPICEGDIANPTACQTGVVYCYACIHKWLVGQHPRQEEFMAERAGQWESGEGRCAITGRRVLGGTEGLRRIMV